MSLFDAHDYAIHAYTLDEANDPRVDSVDDLDLLEVGNVELTVGKFDGAARFRTAGYLNHGSVVPGISTVRCWINPSSIQSGTIWGQGNDTVGTNRTSLSWVDFGALIFTFGQTQVGSAQSMLRFMFCNPDVWSLVVCCLDTTVIPDSVRVSLSVNGAPYDQGDFPLAFPINYDREFRVGATDFGDEQYRGFIDDLVILGGNRVFDQDELDEDWASGAGIPFALWKPPPVPRLILEGTPLRTTVELET